MPPLKNPAVTSPQGKTRMRRARAAIQAIRQGADPALTLSYVVWPTPLIDQAQDKKKAA